MDNNITTPTEERLDILVHCVAEGYRFEGAVARALAGSVPDPAVIEDLLEEAVRRLANWPKP